LVTYSPVAIQIHHKNVIIPNDINLVITQKNYQNLLVDFLDTLKESFQVIRSRLDVPRKLFFSN